MENDYTLRQRWHSRGDDGTHLSKWDYFAFENEEDRSAGPERFVIRAPHSERGTWLLRDMVSGEECECASFAECGNMANRYAEMTAIRRRSDYKPMTEAYTAFGDRVMIESIAPGGACRFRYLTGKYRDRIDYADSPCELYLRKVLGCKLKAEAAADQKGEEQIC